MNLLHKNWLEWTVFGVSSALVLGIAGVLVFDAWTGGDSPPLIEISLGDAQRQGNHFSLPVRVTNRGDQSAEHVRIEIVLRSGDELEIADLELEHLPRHASREGWVSFSRDPRQADEVIARAVGYNSP